MSTSNTDTGDTNAIDAGNIGGVEAEATELAPREALITTAVNFLQNSKVRHTTLMQKQQFLRSKGLTMQEIQLACERAGAFSQDPNSPTVINMDISSQTHSHSQLAVQPTTAFGKIKEILHSMALISGVAYAIYVFWKNFIEAFLFGKKKRKPTDDALQQIDAKVHARFSDFSQELAQIKETLTQQQREQTQAVNREFQNFKSDLEAIKGLLLNRKQFAAPLSSVLPPSIPAWQLASSPHHHLDCHRQSDDAEKGDDAGSGSGSSETEVVTKNSDSSLEIM